MMRVIAFFDLLFFFALDVVKSSMRVAMDVLTPTHRMKPGIIGIDVAGMTDRQLFFMMNMITLTPGSMGIGLSEDRSRLYLHVMYMDGSVEDMRRAYEQSYERKVRRVF